MASIVDRLPSVEDLASQVLNVIQQNNWNQQPQYQRGPFHRYKNQQRRFNPVAQRFRNTTGTQQQQQRREILPSGNPVKPPGDRCDICWYDNHTTDECNANAATIRRRKQKMSVKGHLNMMFDLNTNTLGPIMITHEILVGNVHVSTLIDTGATASFIKQSVLQQLNRFQRCGRVPVTFTGGNSKPIDHTDSISTSVQFNDSSSAFQHTFIVSADLPSM